MSGGHANDCWGLIQTRERRIPQENEVRAANRGNWRKPDERKALENTLLLLICC